MKAVWKLLWGKEGKEKESADAAPGLRCTHCDLVVENPDSLYCPRCCRPLTGAGNCRRCLGCGACDTHLDH